MKLNVDKVWWKNELKMILWWLAATIGVALVGFLTNLDSLLTQLMNGDITKEILISSLSILAFKSFARAVITQIAPLVVGHNPKDVPTESPVVNQNEPTLETVVENQSE